MQLPLFLELSTPLGVQLAPLCSWAELMRSVGEKSLRVFCSTVLWVSVVRRLGPNAAREACRHDVEQMSV